MIYVLGRVRRAGGFPPEPHPGLGVMLLFLLSVAAQFVLLGLATCVASASGPRTTESGLWSGAGLILGGLISAAYPAYAYLTKVRLHGAGRVLRQVLGLGAALTGLAYVAAATVGGEPARPLSVAGVYLAGHRACVLPILQASSALSAARGTTLP